MSSEHYVLDIVLIIAAVIGLLGWLYALGLRREARKLAEGIVEWKRRADEAAFLGKQQKDLADARLGYMTDYEKERDSIWRIYRQMSLSAGSAQHWLFRECERAFQVLNRYRREKGEPPISMDPRLQAVLGEFQSMHPAANIEAVQANLAAQATPNVTESSPALPAPTPPSAPVA